MARVSRTLGRSYRLLLIDKQVAPVKLEQGRFKMARDLAPMGARADGPLVHGAGARLAQQAGGALPNVVSASSPPRSPSKISAFRWGSCGKGGRLYFHWRSILLPPRRSILLPPRIVEYLVVHELVHLLEAHHTPAFWTRVERALPDYSTRKQWLAENAARLDL